MRKLLLFCALLVLLASGVYAQTTPITGTVADPDGRPLPGVTVQVTETKAAVFTNVSGGFSIQAAVGQTLHFSFVGYPAFDVKVTAGATNLKVAFKSGNNDLSEVIVTGYTTERKKDLSGAVSVVNMKDIANIPTGNVLSTLQGRVPGLVVYNDGTPGNTTTGVSLRGVTSINGSSPLYVVDGVQTRENIATLLNPNDVESIQVLKDAASASIYGVQASNGVIIITTKKAKKGLAKVDFDAQVSQQNFHTGIKLLNALEWGQAYWTAYKNDGIKPAHDLYGNGDQPVIPEFINQAKTIRSGDTKWQDEIYDSALLQSYNVSVSKGTDNSNTVFSINYFDQDGLIKYTNFKRVNARLNSDYSFLNNRLRVGENINVSTWNEKVKPGGIEELGISQHPLIPVYDINGGYAGPTQGVGDKPNPVRLLDQAKQNRQNSWRIFGNMFLEAEPIKNLVLRSNFNLNYRTAFLSLFDPRWREGDRVVNSNSLYTEDNYTKDWIWTNSANYNINIGKHAISAFAGTEARDNYFEFLSARRENFLIEAPDYRYLTAGDGKQTNGGLAARNAVTSLFAKANYAYNDKYLLSGTVRRDASSRFGSNNNSAVFPSVSAGWRISQEDFLKGKSSFINDLKLRGSWGQNGIDVADNEATYTKYSTNLTLAGYDIAGVNQGVIPNGIIKDRSANPNIRWEVTTQTDIGIDLAMLNSRLNVTLDYYDKRTKDMIIDRPYIAIIGEGGNIAYNGASMSNKGVEAVINWRDQVNKDWSYSLTFTGSAYKNRVTSVPDDILYTFAGGNGIDKTIVGQPLGSWLGYKTNGLYTTTEQLNDGITQQGKGLGRIRYVDTNGDNVINDRDRVWLGSDQPKFIGGLNVAVTYKAFDFSFFVNGMVRDAYNNAKFYTDFFQLWTGNHGNRLLDAWSPSNTTSTVPALTALNLNDEGRLSEYFIENGSYLKLKNVQIGYTLPIATANRLKMRNLRVYAQGQDLLTVTSYKGADPEGLGYPYPLPRTFTVGLSFGF